MRLACRCQRAVAEEVSNFLHWSGPSCGVKTSRPTSVACGYERLVSRHGRKKYLESRALAGDALHVDSASIRSNDAVYRRQAKSTARGFGREELVEDAGPRLAAHAAPRVGHLQAHVVACRNVQEVIGPSLVDMDEISRDGDRPWLAGQSFRSICDQIDNNLMNVSDVRANCRSFVRESYGPRPASRLRASAVEG